MKKVLQSKEFASAQNAMKIFFLMVQVLLIYYIYTLEKTECECSEQSKLRTIIKYMTSLILVMGLIRMFLMKNKSTPMIVGLLNIVNIGLTVYYLYMLKNCDCAKNWKRLVIFTIYSIIMGLYTLLLTVPMLMFAIPLAILVLPFIIITFVIKYMNK
jgi:hypothetical protein